MFTDLLSPDIQVNTSKVKDTTEICLSSELKAELEKLFQKEEKGAVKVTDYTTSIQVGENFNFFPNQYYYLAVLCKKYATKLYEYCVFFDNNIRSNDAIKKDVLTKNPTSIEYNNLFDNSADKSFFTKFLASSDFRPGKELINGDKFRGTKDIFGSCILKQLPLPDASSNYFGNVVYYLSKNRSVYDMLERELLAYTGNSQTKQDSLSSYVKNFSQIIYYGVPGSGKSNKIDRKTENLPDDQKIRVVFHPEYTNADFVGQILPDNSNGNISYKFKPGPFSRILRRAYLNPSKKYYLIIEEINRGNAAAVFGDIFQLLDRITDDKEISSGNYRYSKGWSRYSIDNDFINWYIRENLYADRINRLENEDDGIAVKSSDESYKSIEIGNLHFSGLTGIRLPPNLSLYATMNTSDQNVFTLDNAFQRRWDMQLVENQFDDKDENATAQRNAKIGNTNVTWEQFQTHINEKIGELSSSMGMSSMEDKRLGCWFVKAENGKISKNNFAEKVLKYLWDDAFKFSWEEIFDIKDKTASLEAIVSAFKGTDETKPCNWKIFKDISFTLKDGTVQSGSDAGETE